MTHDSPSRTAWSLPHHLAERSRRCQSDTQEAAADGRLVLYWLHHAMRAHENPALDVAVTLANQLQLPLLVFQSIAEEDPFASDRHHAFQLQGIRDLDRQFTDRGIPYAAHLQMHGKADCPLRSLADNAAVVVTDEMPVEPYRGRVEALAADISVPLLAVDAACVVPMQVTGKPYERAFAYRRATQEEYDHRVQRNWIDVELDNTRMHPIDLPFEPLTATSLRNIAKLIERCDIDHAIAPVPHTPGGTAAGYDRWQRFLTEDLERYAATRNDPLKNGTSRLSPYLHYGMISPMRIAREAASHGGPGADKFLDELLVWRELAHTFCFYRHDVGTIDALPGWARETLAEHEQDDRPELPSWETLARARTGDPLWDAAQLSLLLHGELHNNVRMTWGKALLNWTPDAQTALSSILDLNHRYALDGRDPSSYGGILWCLGQFDRPFPPPRNITGTVRSRSTDKHAKRLDPQAYRHVTGRPLLESSVRVAVIGAGISGLFCARSLSDHGLEVMVFEKGRGAGGRMATRRTDDGLRFDHGAQYFTARDSRFQRYVDSWCHDGIVAPWQGRVAQINHGEVEFKDSSTRRYVGTPGMSAVCRHLSDDLTIAYSTQVAPPRPVPGTGEWKLWDNEGLSLGVFDVVVSSAPAGQSAELLSAAPSLQERAAELRMDGCWAVMLAFSESLDLPFVGAFVHDSPLSWIACNTSKPARSTVAGECWTLHGSPEWSEQHLELNPDAILAELVPEFWKATGAEPRAPSYESAHRWRYSIPPDPLEDRCLYDPELSLGACGDWCSGPRVEGAFLSGMAMAGRILTHMLA